MGAKGRPVRRFLGTLASVVLLAAGVFVGAPFDPRPATADDGDPAPGPALPPAEAAKAKALFDEAVALQEKYQYAAAKKKFKAFLDDFPGADPELRREADERSADNCFLGMEEIHHGGPSANRIDVELMGDGYLLSQQDKFRKHAEQQMKAFWLEPLYDEYESYFNVWRFDLASKEEGVDDPGAGDQNAPPPPPDPTKKPKPPGNGKTKKLHEYSTALNCQAAGPQRQVWADPDMVFKWRRYLKVSDGLSLCFAKKGELGMGGMGIATTGRMVAVVHEFGHAFIGLLDEYANHPGAPPGRIAAPNAISGKGDKEPPDPANVPWKHWIELGNKEVGVFLGGATYQLGVYRPAESCAMNAGGGSPYCWVCREHGLLKIYEYVSPIDEAFPAGNSLTIAPGSKAEFWVRPMTPKTHKLSVEWYFQKLKTKTVTQEDGEEPAPEPVPDPAANSEPIPKLNPDGWSNGPERGFTRHGSPWAPGPPRGDIVKDTEHKSKEGGVRSVVTLEGLTIGKYVLTARVRDDATLPGAKYPWVIRDPDKLLEERREWIITVGDAAPPTAPVPPAPTNPPAMDPPTPAK